MKIKKSIVEQIVKEESLKVKQIILLKEEEKIVKKQLDELYEENGEMDEGWGKMLFGHLSYDEAKEKILQSPRYRAVYESIPTEEQQQAYVNFAMKNFDYLNKGAFYNEKTKSYQLGQAGKPQWGMK